MTTITKTSICVLFITLVSGCASSEPTFTANGKRGHSIDCSGEFSSWGDCFEEAGEICKAKGYRVLEKIGDKQSSIYADKDILSGSSSYTRSLIIQCTP